jgi:hypothetical protein
VLAVDPNGAYFMVHGEAVHAKDVNEAELATHADVAGGVLAVDPNGAYFITHSEGAKAATALSNTVWTNTKAGYIDMAISDVNVGGAAATDLLTTTVAAGTSDMEFTVTDGPDTNDAYINHSIIVTDANEPNYPEVRKIISYAGATKTVIVDLPFSFTPAAGDTVAIPRAGYAPSGAGWGMLQPEKQFQTIFGVEPGEYARRIIWAINARRKL